MKSAIYVRVSNTDKQDYKRQVEELLEVAQNDGYSKDNIFIYADKISGYTKNIERPKLTEMLNNLPEYEVLYISEVSRLGRKPSEVRKVIDQISDLKIPIYIHNYKQRTIDQNNKENIVLSIIINVLIDISNQEAQILKERSKSGLLSSVKSGKAGGGATLAYGYEKDENKMLVPSIKEAEIIKEIFKMYSNNIGSKKIANYLNTNKIPTKLQNVSKSGILKIKNYTKNVSQIVWGDKQVQEILNNTIYKGQRKYKGLIIPIEPIVSEELFDLCTTIRLSKTHRNYLTKYDYILKDLLICGKCGRNYFAKFKPTPTGDKVYICSSRLKKGSNCGNAGVNITYLESTIYHLLIPSRFLLKYLENKDSLKDSVLSQIYLLENNIASETNLLVQNENQKEKLLDLFIDSIITKDVFNSRHTKIENSISKSHNNITLMKADLADKRKLLSKLNTTDDDSNYIKKITSNRKELISIFKQFITKIVLTKLSGNQLLVDIFITLNGVDGKNSLKLLLDLSIPKRKNNLIYSYWLNDNKDFNLSSLNNVLQTPADEILQSFESIKHKTALNFEIEPESILTL